MTHLKDYLRDIHKEDKIEQDFNDWTESYELIHSVSSSKNIYQK